MFIPVFLSNCTPVSFHMLKCSCAQNPSCLFTYCSFASIGHVDIMWSIISSNCWQSLHLYYYCYYYYYYYTRLHGKMLYDCNLNHLLSNHGSKTFIIAFVSITNISFKIIIGVIQRKTRFPVNHTEWYVRTHCLSSISKVKWSRYRPGLAQRVGRAIALFFHDRGTRREWVVSSTPRPHFTPAKEPVLILQEAGWALGPVCYRGLIYNLNNYTWPFALFQYKYSSFWSAAAQSRSWPPHSWGF